MKKILTLIILVVILAGGYWFLVRPMLKENTVTNPPTPQERKRMEEIERSSSQIAPDAVPGAGVRPVGSLPKTPPPSEESTSTNATSSDEDLLEETSE